VALRGETVGTAFVRILADGTGLPKSIRDEMDDLDDVYEEAGGEHSKAYAKGWKKKSEANRDVEKSLRKQMDRAFGAMRADAESLQDGLEQHIRDGIVNGLRDGVNDSDADKVGERVARNMSHGFERTGVIPKNIRGQVDKALREIEQEAAQFERDWRRDFENTNRDTDRITRDINRHLGTMRREFRTVGSDMRGLFTRLAHDWDDFADTFKRDAPVTQNVMHRLGNTIDTAGNKVGKAFGRGSRNDLLNFFGAFIQAPVEIVARLARGMGSLAESASDARKAFSGAGGGFSGIAAAAGELAPLATNIYAVGGAVGGLILIMGPIAGLISSVAAAIVALGSAVSFALAAGLGVLGGLLAPIAFGITTVALAFLGLSDAMKKGLKEELKGVIDEFNNLKEVAAGGIVKGIQDAAPDIQEALGAITPLIKGASDAIGDVIGSFAKATASPGFKAWSDAMSIFIPNAIRSMGEIAQDVFGGIGGLMQGLIPITQDFLGWLSGIAQQFSDWANSAAGQNAIGDFMDKAADSAQKLWGLLSAVGEAIGLILFNNDARKGGGDILQSMTDAVQRFIEYLKAHPDAIKNWIGDGVDMARQVGRAIKRIGEIFDELDTPENRDLANRILDTINRALEIMPGAISFVQSAFERLGDALRQMPFGDTIADLINIASQADDAWHTVTAGARGMVQPIRNALAAIVGVFLNMVGTVINGAATAFGWIPGIGGRLRTAAAAFDKFKRDVNASLRGVIPTVKTNYSVVGDEEALNDIADIQFELNQIPRAVTTSYVLKMSRVPAPRSASGGMFVSPQTRLIGEDGPEAVVPLNRPLGLVDPAVRALSAIAQGKALPGDTSNNNSRNINVGGLTIVTPSRDPAAVARETVNRMAASSYF